jgi:hypothetical protein
MDNAFEVFLPAGADIAFRFEQPTFEWGGLKHAQGPPEYLYESKYKLIKNPVPGYIISKLPESYKNIDWQCIGIYGEGLQIFRKNLFDIGPEYNDDVLNELLHELLENIEKWVVAFEPDFDCLNEVLEGTLLTVIDKIKFSLAVEKNGFVVYGGINGSNIV